MEQYEFAYEAQEIIENGCFDAAVELMDDDLREYLHERLSPCSDFEFLEAYMREHFERYGFVFTV